MANVHILTEVWGFRQDEVTVTPFSDRAVAVKDFEKRIEEYLEGSDRNVDEEVERAISLGYVFTHETGFIELETMTVVRK